MWYVGGMVYEKNTVCDTWYGIFWWCGMMVRCGGCIMWLNLPGGMVLFQSTCSVRSVRSNTSREYISSVPTLYIDHWNVFENISHADRRTDGHSHNY